MGILDAAAISWPDDGSNLLRLGSALRRPRPGRRAPRFRRWSLSGSNLDVVKLGSGHAELVGRLRYQPDPVRTLALLEAGLDGEILHYHRVNWLRYPRLDTDTDEDGVVDGWSTSGSAAADATFELDPAVDAQKIDVPTSDANRATVEQHVAGIREGDEIVISAAVDWENLSSGTDPNIQIRFLDDVGGLLASTNSNASVDGFARASVSATAPADTDAVEVWLSIINNGTGWSGTVWFRDVMLALDGETEFEPSYPTRLVEPSGMRAELAPDPGRFALGEYETTLRLRAVDGAEDFAEIL